METDATHGASSVGSDIMLDESTYLHLENEKASI